MDQLNQLPLRQRRLHGDGDGDGDDGPAAARPRLVRRRRARGSRWSRDRRLVVGFIAVLSIIATVVVVVLVIRTRRLQQEERWRLDSDAVASKTLPLLRRGGSGAGMADGGAPPIGNEVRDREGTVRERLCPSYGCPIFPKEAKEVFGNSRNPPASSRYHVMLTHKSNRRTPPVNQDRAVLVSPFRAAAADKSENDSPLLPTGEVHPHDDFFAGIFDGHGDEGEAVAQFAVEKIPSRASNKLKSALLGVLPGGDAQDDAVRRVLVESFVEVDQESPPIQAMSGGCTGSVIVRLGPKLYVANAGDSTSFVALYHPPIGKGAKKGGDGAVTGDSNKKGETGDGDQSKGDIIDGKITIVYRNRKDKPNLPDEKERITKRGGKIHIPPKNPNWSRVIVHSSVKREDIGLAMSRSIGDWEWGAVGVVPDPIVDVVDLRELLTNFEGGVQREGEEVESIGTGADAATDGRPRAFFVTGSDGLFDARRAEFVAKHLARGFFEAPHREGDESARVSDDWEGAPPLKEGTDLISLASPKKPELYRDDITFVSMVVEL